MLTVLVLGAVLGILFTYVLEQVLQRNKKLRKEFWEYHKPFLGYHIHHSAFGLPFVLLGLILYPSANGMLMLGVGVGVIIAHTISSRRFVFIEESNKERKNRAEKER